jgi:hypothetical protein
MLDAVSVMLVHPLRPSNWGISSTKMRQRAWLTKEQRNALSLKLLVPRTFGIARSPLKIPKLYGCMEHAVGERTFFNGMFSMNLLVQVGSCT